MSWRAGFGITMVAVALLLLLPSVEDLAIVVARVGGAALGGLLALIAAALAEVPRPARLQRAAPERDRR